MDKPSNDKSTSYPVSTPEVASMLGLSSSNEENHSPAQNHGSDPTFMKDFSQIIGNLFIKNKPEAHSDEPQASGPGHNGNNENASEGSFSKSQPVGRDLVMQNMLNALKAITPYVLVFSVALFIYFYFFNSKSFNFSKTFNSQPKVTSAQETSLAQLQKQNLNGYYQWMAQFYFDVSDAAVLDPNADNSGNGLSNFQKFLLNLNPKSYDTLGLGMADSQALNQGINPLSGAQLTSTQKSIVDKYFDMEVVMNRLALAHLKKSGEVAGTAVTNSSYRSFSIAPQNTQSTGLTVRGNAATQPAASQTEVNNSEINIDTGVPGRLQIPSLKIDVPLIWSTDPKQFDTDLQKGVIHYPGTAMPSQVGTTYISGHSSNYAWAKGSYNKIFATLGDLADNESFSITVKAKDGGNKVLHYVVAGRQQYSPTDQAQFKNSGQSVVALSTCWPVGTTKFRLVVFGQLTQVENQ